MVFQELTINLSLGIAENVYVDRLRRFSGRFRLLTQAASVDLARYQIPVNSVHPGTIATSMTAGYYADPEMRRMILGTTIMERPGELREVSEVVAFLASPGSSCMTGSEVAVDDGCTAT